MSAVVDPAGERIVLYRSAATFEPSEEAAASIRHDFELDWSTGLLLNHHCSRSQLTAGDKVTNPDLHKIAASQFAVDRKIEKRPVAKSLRQAVHSPDNSRKVKKSKLNCPGQPMAAISPKKTGNRFHPCAAIVTPV